MKNSQYNPDPPRNRVNVLDKTKKEDDLLEAFGLDLRRQDKAELTIQGYLQDLRIFANWFSQTNGQEFKPDILTALDLREYKQYMLSVQKAAPATINRYLAAIRAFMQWAQKNDLILFNPIKDIKSLEQPATAPKWIDRREQLALRKAVERARLSARTEAAVVQALRDRALILLLLNTGLRVSELCALDMRDLQFSERKGELRISGKGQKIRQVSLNKEAREALGDWLKKRPENNTSALFTGKRGQRLSSSGVHRRVAELGSRAGLEISAHILRHTFAKNLVDSGVSLDRVAALLGHASLDTTMIYTMPGKVDLERAVERLVG